MGNWCFWLKVVEIRKTWEINGKQLGIQWVQIEQPLFFLFPKDVRFTDTDHLTVYSLRCIKQELSMGISKTVSHCLLFDKQIWQDHRLLSSWFLTIQYVFFLGDISHTTYPFSMYPICAATHPPPAESATAVTEWLQWLSAQSALKTVRCICTKFLGSHNFKNSHFDGENAGPPLDCGVPHFPRKNAINAVVAGVYCHLLGRMFNAS